MTIRVEQRYELRIMCDDEFAAAGIVPEPILVSGITLDPALNERYVDVRYTAVAIDLVDDTGDERLPPVFE